MTSRTDRPVYVALDSETTGLNPQFDRVIEIGIVRFTADEILDRYQHIVSPGRPLTREISTLTGITQEMVDDAPTFDEIAADVRAFIGDDPIVGHNVGFDTSMLEAEGLTFANPVIDTYVLATGLLHDVANFQLGTLASYFGYDIAAEDRHRAMGDTLATAHVFQHLIRRLSDYDTSTLRQIAQNARRARWKEAWFFERVARDAAETPLFSAGQMQAVPLELRFMAPRERPEPLRPTGNHDPIDTHMVEELLGAEGPLGDVLAGYTPRPTQITMARRVAESLNKEQNLLVEAGTGTGKSLAYLLPAAIFAVQRGERVVVSTATIALQDQLHHKDLPDVHVALQQAGLARELNVAVMKGRQNYLCLKQLFQHLGEAAEDEGEASLRAKILLWLGHTETGDRAELRLTPEEERHWRKYASERGRCTVGRCSFASSNQCFFHRARHEAAHAHIVIANHSLLLANLAEGRVLPPFEHLIVDEAHHLEDEATRQLSFSVNREVLDDAVKMLVRQDSGLAAGAIPSASSLLLRMNDPSALQYHDRAREKVALVQDAVSKIVALTGELFARVGTVLGKPTSTPWAQSLRITSGTRDGGKFVDAAIAWDQLEPHLNTVLEAAIWFQQALEEVALPKDENNPLVQLRDEATVDLMSGIDELSEIARNVSECFIERVDSASPRVYWIQRSSQQQVLSLNGAPLDVSGLLSQQVYAHMRAVIMTSATMTIDGSFDFVESHLGMEGSRHLDLGSPFDHMESTLVYIPQDMPEPNHPNYSMMMNEALAETLIASGGRALVLFTSHKALRDARNALKERLEPHNIIVLGQGVDGNTRSLIERLRHEPGTVVFGTSTFWEGVDVVGDALSVLIVTKFPFPVPSDPVFEARGEQYQNSFMELSLPLAVLKFKQGFGRLIRTDRDRGICVILDKRVISKRYGSTFVESLPPANVTVGSVDDLPASAKEWIRPVST